MNAILGIYLGMVLCGILSLPILLSLKGAILNWRLLLIVFALPILALRKDWLRWSVKITD